MLAEIVSIQSCVWKKKKNNNLYIGNWSLVRRVVVIGGLHSELELKVRRMDKGFWKEGLKRSEVTLKIEFSKLN